MWCSFLGFFTYKLEEKRSSLDFTAKLGFSTKLITGCISRKNHRICIFMEPVDVLRMREVQTLDICQLITLETSPGGAEIT